MTNTIVEEVLTAVLGLSGPQVLALRLGAMVVSDLLKRPEIAPTSDSSILSSVPGRTRLAAEGLRGSARLARQIERRIGQLPSVEKVSASAVTGTVLVIYDQDRLGVAELSRAVRMAGMALRVAAPKPRLVPGDDHVCSAAPLRVALRAGC